LWYYIIGSQLKKNFILYIIVLLLLLDSLGVRVSLILSDRLIETLFHAFIIEITSSFLPYELDIYVLRIRSEFFLIKTYMLDELYISFLKILFSRRITSQLFPIEIWYTCFARRSLAYSIFILIIRARNNHRFPGIASR
jgi:hypothetical protein